MPWNLIGNERAVRVLEMAIASTSMPHAFLFIGPESTGRATAARRLAQGLNCTGEAPPCLECGQCRRIESGIHSDVLTVGLPDSGDGPAKKVISIEQMREVQQAAALAPYEGRMRVTIIDPASALSPDAQNAFLKTLEEPPPHAVFVLIADDGSALLETVHSRCTPVEFRLAVAADIEEGLLARGTEPERAHLLARLAAGRPGWAVRVAGDPAALERRSEAISQARSLTEMPLPDRIDFAEKLSEAFRKEREPVIRTLDVWLGWWRDVLLLQADAEAALANVDMLAEARADAAEYGRAEVTRFLQTLLDTRQYLGENVQSRIALDALMLDVPGGAPSRRSR